MNKRLEILAPFVFTLCSLVILHFAFKGMADHDAKLDKDFQHTKLDWVIWVAKQYPEAPSYCFLDMANAIKEHEPTEGWYSDRSLSNNFQSYHERWVHSIDYLRSQHSISIKYEVQNCDETKKGLVGRLGKPIF